MFGIRMVSVEVRLSPRQKNIMGTLNLPAVDGTARVTFMSRRTMSLLTSQLTCISLDLWHITENGVQSSSGYLLSQSVLSLW